MSKESKELKKIKNENELQARIINKIKNPQVLKKYIDEDEIISYIVELLEYNRFKVHRDTFKKFIYTKYEYDVENMKIYELEAAVMNQSRFNNVTPGVVDSKLEELKYLKLIEYQTYNNHILGTDLLRTILAGKYKRISKSTKNENQFIMETEDKLFAYRHLIADKHYLENNKEFIEELDTYNNIYVINRNQFVIGRRDTETEKGLYNRMKKLLKSSLVDTKAYTIDPETKLIEELEIDKIEHIEDGVILKQIPLKLYFNKKMRINERKFKDIFDTLPNDIEIIRY